MQENEAVIFETVYNQIMLLLAKKWKVEVVGLCFGHRDEDRIEIRSFKQMDNLDNSATSFSLDYEIMYKEIQNYEKKKELLVGIFHSHPEGAKLYPSQKDLHYMHYWPYPYIWLIGGYEGEKLDSQLLIFSLLEGEIIEIPYSRMASS
ncbi:MAG: Mov34/MPN/PAD-1 family protein [Candidatus Thorarchaeota archaeon]